MRDFAQEELPLVDETLSKCVALILERLKINVRPKQFQILTDDDYEKYEGIDAVQRTTGNAFYNRDS